VLSAAESPYGHKNVHKWIDGVPDADLYISVITVMEARKGFSRQRANAKTPAQMQEALGYEADFEDILVAYGDKIVLVDRSVAERWGEMLAKREVNVMDTAVAATAMVHGLVIATRNVKHFRGRGVRVIDPFKINPDIAEP